MSLYKEDGKTKSVTRILDNGAVLKYIKTADGDMSPDMGDSETKKFFENELKKQQTQEQIASGVQNTIGIFDKIKSIFSKKDDDKKEGGGFFSDIIEALLGPKALSYLSSGIGLLASGATLLAKGGIGLAIATYIGPTVIDIVKGIGESIFKGIIKYINKNLLDSIRVCHHRRRNFRN